MPKKTPEQEWEYPSLEWIRQAREAHREAEKGIPLTQLEPRLSRVAAAVARRLKLKTVRASNLSARRQRAV